MLSISLKTLESNIHLSIKMCLLRRKYFRRTIDWLVWFFCLKKDKLEGGPEVTGKEAKPYIVT